MAGMTRKPAVAAAAPPRDSLGCSLDTLEQDRRLEAGHMTFYRKKAASAPPGRVTTPATNRGYLLGLSASNGHRRRVFGEHGSTVHDFEENSVYLRSFADDYKAELSGSFDFILLEVNHGALERIADGADSTYVSDLTRIAARPDPVLAGMLGALFVTVGGSSERSALFVDQLAAAIGIHLVQQYGNGRATIRDRDRVLSAPSRAKLRDLVQSRLDGSVTVEGMARLCNLSTSAFLRSFRKTLGRTPHQWLVQQRIEKASHLLAFSPMPLSEIATACGFADQSHFTRAFFRATGTTPRAWRRSRKS